MLNIRQRLFSFSVLRTASKPKMMVASPENSTPPHGGITFPVFLLRTGMHVSSSLGATSAISQIRFVEMNSLFNVKLNFPWQIVSPRYHSDELSTSFLLFKCGWVDFSLVFSQLPTTPLINATLLLSNPAKSRRRIVVLTVI